MEETLTELQIVYTMHDIKSRLWSTPQIHESEEALFQFLNVIVNSHGAGAQHTHPEDFVVYEIGTFNEETGELLSYDEKVIVCTLSSLKKECTVCKAEQEKTEELANG